MLNCVRYSSLWPFQIHTRPYFLKPWILFHKVKNIWAKLFTFTSSKGKPVSIIHRYTAKRVSYSARHTGSKHNSISSTRRLHPIHICSDKWAYLRLSALLSCCDIIANKLYLEFTMVGIIVTSNNGHKWIIPSPLPWHRMWKPVKVQIISTMVKVDRCN